MSLYGKTSIERGNFKTSLKSNVAYKLPFRGNNYRFFGTIRYHLIGTAYASQHVHNTIVESFNISENNCNNTNFKILKCSNRRTKGFQRSVEQKNGYNIIIMTPKMRKGKSLFYYNSTGLFRYLFKYNNAGVSKFNKNYAIDFESLAQYIINLDDASKQYNLKIKRIIFDKRFIKKLYETKNGKELKKRDIHFAKYLSKKVNRKYDDLFYVEFENI